MVVLVTHMGLNYWDGNYYYYHSHDSFGSLRSSCTTKKKSKLSTAQNSLNLVGIGLYQLNYDCLHLVGLEWSEIVVGRYNSRNSDQKTGGRNLVRIMTT